MATASLFFRRSGATLHRMSDRCFWRRPCGYLELFQKRNTRRFREDIELSFVEYSDSNIVHWSRIPSAIVIRDNRHKMHQPRCDGGGGGIESRLEHIRLGGGISRGLLSKHKSEHPGSLSEEDIRVILDIVASHDYSKIPLMEDHVDRKWLLSWESKDWLKQYHWEADALRMLTPDGILIDLEREREEDTPKIAGRRFYSTWAYIEKSSRSIPEPIRRKKCNNLGFTPGCCTDRRPATTWPGILSRWVPVDRLHTPTGEPHFLAGKIM
jgi:hypothetical protein